MGNLALISFQVSHRKQGLVQQTVPSRSGQDAVDVGSLTPRWKSLHSLALDLSNLPPYICVCIHTYRDIQVFRYM